MLTLQLCKVKAAALLTAAKCGEGYIDKATTIQPRKMREPNSVSRQVSVLSVSFFVCALFTLTNLVRVWISSADMVAVA